MDRYKKEKHIKGEIVSIFQSGASSLRFSPSRSSFRGLPLLSTLSFSGFFLLIYSSFFLFSPFAYIYDLITFSSLPKIRFL